MKHLRRGSTLLLIACIPAIPLLFSGCVSNTLQEIREADTGILSHESIAVLGRRDTRRDQTETAFMDCLVDKTSSGSKSVNVISNDEFVDQFFPWFEPRTAPLDISDMTRILKEERISEKLDEIHLRYIVWIDGTTQRTDQGGTVQCAVATGGVPACFGFLTWEAGSNYEATIWDIRKGVSAGKVSSEAKGTSFVPAIIVPLPFVARTQASACVAMSKQLKEFIDPDPSE